LGGLWALEWPWHSAETNLRCAGILGIFIVFEISAFIRTDGQTDMAHKLGLASRALYSCGESRQKHVNSTCITLYQ